MSSFKNTGDGEYCNSSIYRDGRGESLAIENEIEEFQRKIYDVDHLEKQLNEARSNFRLYLTETSQKIRHHADKLSASAEDKLLYKSLSEQRANSDGLPKENQRYVINNDSRSDQNRLDGSSNIEERLQNLNRTIFRSVMKSSLSARRSLLMMNNLANQHQLQLLPYFEMKVAMNANLDDYKKKVFQTEQDVRYKFNEAPSVQCLNELDDMTSVSCHQLSANNSQLFKPTEATLWDAAKFEDFTDDDVFYCLPKNYLTSSRISLKEHILMENTRTKTESKPESVREKTRYYSVPPLKVLVSNVVDDLPKEALIAKAKVRLSDQSQKGNI